MKEPVLYSDALENIVADEEKVHQGLAREFHKIITATHRDNGWADRGVHAKSHALLEGTIQIHDDLPDVLAQGLFAQPDEYSVVVRISSIPGDPLDDAVSGPRGFALKINNVKGELLSDNEGVPVQDILLVNGPVFAAPDSRHFLRTLRLLALTTNRFNGFKKLLSRSLRALQKQLNRFGKSNDMIGVLGGYLPTVPVGDRFFSQVPLRFGKYVAKFDIVPSSESFRRQQGMLIDIDKNPVAIRQKLNHFFSEYGGEWTLRAQLCRDLEENSIEDATKVWSEDDNPFLPLATIKIPPQDSWSKERAERLEDGLSFSPWHGLTAHRPLGDIMRARRVMYPFSSKLRTRLNGCPLHFRVSG
ncbi:catalase family protein [Bombella sp. TMW 2.2559]|uniref:Catalase family protein n=1 Tax=Bombella dulcis TaxID=2967339 RepID=A0ABT3WE30_9PROT|nr:catalase family protein [Bombella dulcis]MCX5616052.1 catalase family protein [Bombella dulcis]